MKNKILLKKFILTILLISVIILIVFINAKNIEYKLYINNYNAKINQVMDIIKNKYPEVSETEIINVLNTKQETENNVDYKKYGIDIKNDSIIQDNENIHRVFMFGNILLFSITVLILLIMFLIYNNKKDRELRKITKYIEQINRKNYVLDIDELSEDELSILKNEIYKTTVMLKENSDNSIRDKKELKKSLEDISHQLKTPLTSILIMLDNLIEDKDMDEKIRQEFIRDIKREIININTLVQTLLKLSKFDVNTIKFTRNNYLIKELIDNSVKNIATLCDLKNIKIIINGNEKSSLKCDFIWEVEAITNILKNCTEHSGKNSKININYDENNIYSIIEIQDYGEGISQKDLPHIFERFYQSQNSSGESVGIGLALTKKIIENDNGVISVESDGNGTKFIIKYFKI